MALVTLCFTCLLSCHLFSCMQTVGLAMKVREAELILMVAGPASSLTMGCDKNAELDTSAKLERSGAVAWRMGPLRMNWTWYRNGWPRVFQVKRMCRKTLKRKNTICKDRKASRFLFDGVENRGNMRGARRLQWVSTSCNRPPGLADRPAFPCDLLCVCVYIYVFFGQTTVIMKALT